MLVSFYFQLFLIIFISFTIINHKYINEKLNKKYGEPDTKGEEIIVEKIDGLDTVLKEHGLKIGLFLLPLIMLIYSDMKHPMSTLTKLDFHGIINKNNIEKIHYVLKVLGAYGIIQILAQDMGIKTGYIQRELVQSKIIQFFLFSGTAYALTTDISQAFMGTILYFILKYSISNNRTSQVCDLGEYT